MFAYGARSAITLEEMFYMDDIFPADDRRLILS